MIARTEMLTLTFVLRPDEPPDLILVVCVDKTKVIYVADLAVCWQEWEAYGADFFFPDNVPHGTGELVLTGTLWWDTPDGDFAFECESGFEVEDLIPTVAKTINDYADRITKAVLDKKPLGKNEHGPMCKCGHPKHPHVSAANATPAYQAGCQVCDCKGFVAKKAQHP